MYTVTEENGRLNNYAVEPQITYAEAPSNTEKRNYLIQGAIAFSLIVGTIVTAFVVS